MDTLLRLPTGLFYAQGVKANVIFFDKKPASETAWTKRLWIYDLRTNKHFTLKTNPQEAWNDETHPHPSPPLEGEGVSGWQAGTRKQQRLSPPLEGEGASGRWRAYEYDELIARDKASLDIFWLKHELLADSDNLPPPEVIARAIVQDLEAALEQFRLIAGDLNGRSEVES